MQSLFDNPVVKAVLERQTIREYITDRPITDEELEVLKAAALRAPSGRNTQPCHVRFIKNADMLKEMNTDFKELVGYDTPAYTNWDIHPFYHNAPLLIQIFAEGASHTDGGIMCENLCIAAKGIGLGSCIIGSIGALYDAPVGNKWKKAVDIPESFVHLISVSVGAIRETPPMKPRFDDRIKVIG